MRARWIVVVGCALASVTTPAGAATFDVDTTRDGADRRPGDERCETATGRCTIRAALQEAASQGGSDTVVVPAGVFRLSLRSGRDDAARGDLDVGDRTTLIGAGPRRTIIDARAIDRVMEVTASGARVSGLTLRGGRTSGDGGGLLLRAFETSVSEVQLLDNLAEGRGGGAMVSASYGGLHDFAADRNVAREGGGVYATGSEMSVSHGSLVANRATERGGGMVADAPGAGARPNLAVEALTVAGNTAGIEGGGLVLRSDLHRDRAGGAAHVTVTQNYAPVAAGAVLDGTVYLVASIVAANRGPNCRTGAPAPADGGMFAAGVFTDGVIADDDTCAGARVVADALVQPPRYNGGLFRSSMVRFDSPAVDALSTDACRGTDQRGVPRPQGPGCDAGAVERLPTERVRHAGRCATRLRGGPRRDRITGGPQGDALFGFGAADVIFGRGGEDCLFGGDGADALFGADGDDDLTGGAQNDRLDGGRDDDLLVGDSGHDRLSGADGDDTLQGGRGGDLLRGGDGFDVLLGGPGNDDLDARDGEADVIACGPGRDRVLGEEADEVAADCEVMIQTR